MARMIHDMDEADVRDHIRKVNDERSNPKYRLTYAVKLADLLTRMLDSIDAPEEDAGEDTPQPATQPAVQPEEFEPAVDGDGKPIHADDLPKKEGIVKKIFE